MANEPYINKVLFSFLKLCFYANLTIYVLLVLSFFVHTDIIVLPDTFEFYFKIIMIPVCLMWAFLLVYCVYFWYKFDREGNYASKLWILGSFFVPFYFYKVVWKRTVGLKGAIKGINEPVLGTTIPLMEEEDEN